MKIVSVFDNLGEYGSKATKKLKNVLEKNFLQHF